MAKLNLLSIGGVCRILSRTPSAVSAALAELEIEAALKIDEADYFPAKEVDRLLEHFRAAQPAPPTLEVMH